MAEPLTLKLQTLTPLWTGGLDGKMEHIHAAGLIGSLRWWYEALVRGLGGQACDPTDHSTEHACNFDAGQYEKAAGLPQRARLRAAGLCDACQFFGATGWRRRFRLDAMMGQGAAAWPGDQPINLRPHDRTRGWYLQPGWMGELALTLIGEEQAIGQVAALLLFLEQWGGLGAKQQFGYGAFRLDLQEQAALNRRASFMLPGGQQPRGALPDLRDFTFFQVRFRPARPEWWAQVDGIRQVRQRPDQWQSLTRLAQQGAVPVNAALKNHWRYGQPWPSREIEAWLFGILRGDIRLRSKVNPGWAVRAADGSWHITGWAWLPRDAESRPHYDAVVGQMCRLLGERAGWQSTLNLVGAVQSLEITLTNGLDAWNAVARQVSGGIG